MANNFRYLGVSTRTITSFDAQGRVEYAVGFFNVIQAIARALKIQGDVFFLRAKNSGLRRLMFQPRDNVTADLLRYFIIKAIQENVKQVAAVSVEVLFPEQENLLNAKITFKVISSNEVGSFIYPFFLQNEDGLRV